MSHSPATESVVQASIQDLRLRPGSEVKLLDSKGNMLTHKAQFIAVFSGKSVLISMLVDDSRNIALHEGDTYQVRGFTGQYDFAFTSTVLHVDGAQFNARLSYPDSVFVKFVRSHLRVRLNQASTVTLARQNSLVAVVINDVSVGGAGLHSSAALGEVGDRVQLALAVEFEKKPSNLSLTAVIRHISQTSGGEVTGVEFVDLSQHDKLLLHYLVNSKSEESTAN